MTKTTSRQLRAEERRRQILDAARERANAQGWAAVTTRHLAETIGYSQPVLYGHFPGGKAEIMLAVALEGFSTLTENGRNALQGKRGRAAIEAVATAYLNFAKSHPAVYEAMFREAIDTPFASEETVPELRAGFEVLSAAMGPDADPSAVEVYWAALHGMSLLESAGRMRPEHRAERIRELGSRFAAVRSGRTIVDVVPS